MDRIMIFGFSGGGKSTLARKLGEKLGIEPVHMDRLHWLPGWVESSREYKINRLAPVLERDRWIIEGNYRGVLWNERTERADTIIFVDVNRFTCFKNAFLRSLKYKNQTRPDMGEGCNEKFDLEFAKWILLDGRKKRRRNISFTDAAKAAGKETHIFRSIKQMNRWLDNLETERNDNK